jgi:DNA-binding NarL/FixJ family response regulator
MSRAVRADRVLCWMMSGGARDGHDAGNDAFGLGLAGLQAIWLADEVAIAHAAGALAGAGDPVSLTLARAVAALAIAQFGDAIDDPRLRDPRTAGDVLEAALDDPQPLDPQFEPVLRVLLAEAALACARVDLAVALLADFDEPEAIFGREDHPFLTFSRVVRVRVRTFAGDVTAARDLAEVAVSRAGTALEVLITTSVAALVLGNADDRGETRQMVELVERHGIAPVDIVTRGCYVLAAYGAVALGDLPRAVRLLLMCGGGPGLEALRVIDRALGLELLVSAAIEDGDVDAAHAWLGRALLLADHPIAASTVARIRSRVALLADNPDSAIEWAEDARLLAQRDGRAIESAEAAIILARARIASAGGGRAVRDLATDAAPARAAGHKAFLRAAARELRHAGRRLPPDPTSGWNGLSPRERDVALLLADGLTNAEIARRLFLSTHTVRMHTSRVLHAFGTSSRVGIARALPPTSRGQAVALTTRQNQIVDAIVAGASNREIAESLGIAVSTVEKHIAEVMRRWGARSRAGVVRVAGTRYGGGEHGGAVGREGA